MRWGVANILSYIAGFKEWTTRTDLYEEQRQRVKNRQLHFRRVRFPGDANERSANHVTQAVEHASYAVHVPRVALTP